MISFLQLLKSVRGTTLTISLVQRGPSAIEG